jgi:4-hydroxythreonine-4-phosphate dehydrogenase
MDSPDAKAAPGPLLLITMGDVAGIGPEIIARGWADLCLICHPVVVGDPDWLQWAFGLVGSPARVVQVSHPAELEATPTKAPCLLGTSQDLRHERAGQVSAAAGRAAYDFLCAAIDRTMNGEAQGIVTAPLHKEGLKRAGLPFPGHTEILAERTGTRQFAMVLSCDGLAVAHVTLHMALRDVFRHLSTGAILEKIHLLDALLPRLLSRRPRLAVLALNPHASDGGLFGDEEMNLIAPAVQKAQAQGVTVSGPWPSDTLFVRARRGEFDGIVAMYHDQGHIALKLIGGMRAVNISAGLPLVRTSVAHGTAYDIAGRGVADAASLLEAARVAARLAQGKGDGRGLANEPCQDWSEPEA